VSDVLTSAVAGAHGAALTSVKEGEMSEGECSREEQETFQAEKQVKMSDLRKRIAELESANTLKLSILDDLDRASKRIAELEAALKEIQDHCAGKTGSLQAVVVVIVRKALEGR